MAHKTQLLRHKKREISEIKLKKWAFFVVVLVLPSHKSVLSMTRVLNVSAVSCTTSSLGEYRAFATMNNDVAMQTSVPTFKETNIFLSKTQNIYIFVVVVVVL